MGKLEFSEDEQALINRYRFDEATRIVADDRHLLRVAVKLGSIVFVIAAPLFTYLTSSGGLGVVLGLAAGVGTGYWHLNEKGEIIFVKDLLHGRNLTCDSVIGLAKKEACLEGACSMFRQVMESALHWGGTAHHLTPCPMNRPAN